MSQGFQNRKGYLPSSGAPDRSIPFDVFWTNLGYTESLAGVWDTKLNSGDEQIVVSDTQDIGGSDRYLVKQYIFPAFGDSIGKLILPPTGQNPCTISPGPSIMGKTSLVDSLSNAYSLRFVTSARVFSTLNVFKYYINQPPISANANFASLSLKGIVSGIGTTLTTNIPISTDYLVIEVGLYAASFLIKIKYDVTFQFGDNHPTDAITNSTVVGNSWMNFRYWTLLGSGGWQLNEA